MAGMGCVEHGDCCSRFEELEGVPWTAGESPCSMSASTNLRYHSERHNGRSQIGERPERPALLLSNDTRAARAH